MSQEIEAIDISSIPYLHRSSAADLLIAKATRLAGLSERPITHLGEKELEDRELRKARQALSYYDMALLLLKPHDVNYQTVINWKCLTLIEMGQFEDACKWYQQLIRTAVASGGPKCANPTRDLAEEQLEKYAGRRNRPIQAVKPEFCLRPRDW